jgi:uncharacterized metal-binding protein YceD (DUF177 family)
MPVKVNLRHLEEDHVHLEGELSPEELEIEHPDELVHVNEPLHYDLEIERANQTILVQGSLSLAVDCECARCLKPFREEIDLMPWEAIVPLEGEDQVPVENDLVDLTPAIREDILLALPQHPLCEPECTGLPVKNNEPSSGTSQTGETSSAWAELNKLKF